MSKNNLDLSNLPIHLKKEVIPTKYLFIWYEYHLPNLLKKNKNSSIFFPSGICSILNFPKDTQIISTIHDVACFMSLKYYPLTYKIRPILGRIYRKISFVKLIKNSDYIFTVSNTAKKGIERIASRKKLKLPNIYVFYNASEINNISKPQNKNKSFYVSQEKIRKRIINV